MAASGRRSWAHANLLPALLASSLNHSSEKKKHSARGAIRLLLLPYARCQRTWRYSNCQFTALPLDEFLASANFQAP